MKIVSCVLPEEKSPDWTLFQMLMASASIPNVEFEAIVIRDRNDILRIPNAQLRFEALHDGLDSFPIVLVNRVIKARGRLLTGAEYEDLFDGLSIQET